MSNYAADLVGAAFIAVALVLGYFAHRLAVEQRASERRATEWLQNEAKTARCPICGWQMLCDSPEDADDMLTLHELVKFEDALLPRTW
jgi:hypothetical protein